jgi:AraC-like DNA-binding protein
MRNNCSHSLCAYAKNASEQRAVWRSTGGAAPVESATLEEGRRQKAPRGAADPAAFVSQGATGHSALHASSRDKQADINPPAGGTTAEPVRKESSDRRRAVFAAACAVIRERYRDPDLALADVAAAVGVSTRQLQRVFREVGGENFRSCLLRVRMERAAALLGRENEPLPVHVVARHVGYRQASGLRQAFRRHFGVNPSTIQPAPPEYVGETVFGAE